MEYLLAVLFLVGSLTLIVRMMTSKSLIAYHLGVISIFSLGYYILPVFMQSRSSLGGFTSAQVTTALGIHVLFFTAMVCGALAGSRMLAGRVPRLNLPSYDAAFTTYRLPTYMTCAAVYLLHFSLYRQTSYSSADFNAYFTDRDPAAAILQTISGFALGAAALCFAMEWRNGKRRRAAFMAIGLVAFVLLSISLAQRLAIITPIIMVVAALAVTGQHRLAIRALPVLILVLVVVSPIAVMLRQMQLGLHGQAQAATLVADANVAFGQLDLYVQSILDRSDLIRNTVKLKDYIDTHGFAGPAYYESVLSIPIPRALFPAKPYLLSTDGTMWGELTVVSWVLDHGRGTIGSLTAFGGISAYQEGGWPTVVLDGFATGAFFAFLATWLGGGGLTARLFYVMLFPALAIKRVPPNLFEALAEFLTILPFIVAAYALDRLWANMPRNRDIPSTGRQT